MTDQIFRSSCLGSKIRISYRPYGKIKISDLKPQRLSIQHPSATFRLKVKEKLKNEEK